MLGGALYGEDYYGRSYVGGTWVGNDYEAGGGNDLLNGTLSGDIYRFNLGDGQDVINENGPADYYTDRIVLGAGIASGDVHGTRDGQSLVLNIGTNGDRITAANWYQGTEYQVERLEFADGTVWSAATLTVAGLGAARHSGRRHADSARWLR